MKKIAIIGASYLQLPLVRKAKEMGIETHCFAWEEGSVCKDISDFYYPISILDKEQILDKCLKINIDGIISIASDAAVPTISFISESMGLPGNYYRDALVTTNKFLMRKRFVEHYINSPKFELADKNYFLKEFKYPLIVKPTDRSGSRGIRKIQRAGDLKIAVENARKESFKNEVIIEEFIDGVEVSVEAISWKGEHFILAITDKVTTESPYFVELEHHQPSQLNNEIIIKIRNETLKALKALNVINGASHTELKITKKGEVFIIEVGARMGGDFIGSDLVQLSTGYDFLRGVINVSLDHFEIPTLNDFKYSGIYFICAETNRLLQNIHNAKIYPEIIEARLTDNNLRSVKSSSDRSGYIIYQGEKRFIL